MNIMVLNKKFETVGIVDAYRSFIWVDRYNEKGDFEILMSVDSLSASRIQKNYYLWNSESEHMMIIESIKMASDIEDGAWFTITGRSLETILERRIIWNKMVFNATVDENDQVLNEPNLQNGIKEMLTTNVINPSITVRKISNFIFEESDDEKITSLTFEGEYLGNDLYKTIRDLCVENEIGFKLTYHESYTKNEVEYKNVFVFKLYAGVDRSYEQMKNPHVVFSPSYNNIMNSSYIDSDETLKNVTLIVGESEYDDEGKEVSRREKTLSINDAIYTELDRREIFTDATSLSTDDGYGGVLTPAQYQARLKQKGIDTLMANTSINAFEGEVDPTKMYEYQKDYFIGDIVQIVNEYGQEGRAYISEYIMSYEESGVSAYPTFKTIQKGVYEA